MSHMSAARAKLSGLRQTQTAQENTSSLATTGRRPALGQLGRAAFRAVAGAAAAAPEACATARTGHVRGPSVQSVQTELVALDVLHDDARLVVAIGSQ